MNVYVSQQQVGAGSGSIYKFAATANGSATPTTALTTPTNQGNIYIRLSHIDEALIEKYVIMRRKTVGIVAVNRELATLRRMLHVALEWKLIQSIPKVRLLPGEKNRTFILDRKTEVKYLAVCPPLLRAVATLMVDSGLRLGEGMALQWADIHEPVGEGRYGWIDIRDGKSKNAKRTVPLTPRVYEMLKEKKKASKSVWVFPGDNPEKSMCGTSVAHIHSKVCRPYVKENGKRVQRFIFPKDFVLHSLRHTFLTRMGEAGADAFTIMKTAGHSSVTVSQRYVHPTSETVQLVFDRMVENSAKSSEKVSGGKIATFLATPNEEAA